MLIYQSRSLKLIIWAVAVSLLLMLPVAVFAGTAGNKRAASTRARAQARLRSQVARSRSELIKLTKDYRATLENMLILHSAAEFRASELEEQRQKLFQEGLVSHQELIESEQAYYAEKTRLISLRNQITETDELLAEIISLDDSGRLFNLPSGQFSNTDLLIRFTGTISWSINNIDQVERFFSGRFGHRLPISAFGQSAVHDRLGFDHHNSVDVALHPDSLEGQALLEFLRSAGIPFLAFRQALPGAATGPHIHIGHPSARF